MKTDYHCHILPGIDDGAKDIEESVFLAQKLVEWGFERAICTPHSSYSFHNTPSTVLPAYTALVKALEDIRTLNVTYTNDLRDALIERLRAAGIDVNTDWQEGERVLVQENGHTREMSRNQKRAMETASVSHDEEHQHAVMFLR